MRLSSKTTALLRTLLLLAAASTTTVDALPRVHYGVHRALRDDGCVNLMVTMVNSSQPLEAFQAQEGQFDSRTAKIEALRSHLQDANQDVTSHVVKLLRSCSASAEEPLHAGFKNFWISNQVFIRNATIDLVDQLMEMPSIAEVREEVVIELDDLLHPPVESAEEDVSLAGGSQDDSAEASAEVGDNGFFDTLAEAGFDLESSAAASDSSEAEDPYGWGIGRISAEKLWALGYTGKGVRVGSIDSGVRYTHEVLKDSFAGNYGWFDPQTKNATPYDASGHGTHTMGTIAGINGIGVAPGVTWMTCKGCRATKCVESELLRCGQFILCPTDTTGNNANCSYAPDIVSNSWGGSHADTFYKTVVDAWVAAGIIPVVSNGNAGPECSTATSPADYANVISVGSLNQQNGLSLASSKGPSGFSTGIIKPDITAPGVLIKSSWFDADDSYWTTSGTSMAAPHVSGAIALLLSIQPTLTFDDVKSILFSTTDQTALRASRYSCGNTSDSTWPNNQYGYGVLDVYSAFLGQRESSSSGSSN